MTEFITRKQRKRVESLLRPDEDFILGGVKINHDLCKGCKFCVNCCVASTLEIVEKKCRMIQDQPFCMACADCVARWSSLEPHSVMISLWAGLGGLIDSAAHDCLPIGLPHGAHLPTSPTWPYGIPP